MAVALIIIRQELIRDLVRHVAPTRTEFDDVLVVGTSRDAVDVLRQRAVDVIVMGSAFIEDAKEMIATQDCGRRPMTVVLFDEKTPSVRERARLNEIDVLVEASKGIETAGDAIIVAYANFRSGKRRFGVSSAVGVLAPASAIRIHDDFDREIVEMIAVGYGDRDISDAVFLSHQTVRNRVSRILHDNDMKNRTHLACKYLKLMHDERQLFEHATLSVEKNCSKRNNQLPINFDSQSIGAP